MQEYNFGSRSSLEESQLSVALKGPRCYKKLEDLTERIERIDSNCHVVSFGLVDKVGIPLLVNLVGCQNIGVGGGTNDTFFLQLNPDMITKLHSTVMKLKEYASKYASTNMCHLTKGRSTITENILTSYNEKREKHPGKIYVRAKYPLNASAIKCFGRTVSREELFSMIRSKKLDLSVRVEMCYMGSYWDKWSVSYVLGEITSIRD